MADALENIFSFAGNPIQNHVKFFNCLFIFKTVNSPLIVYLPRITYSPLIVYLYLEPCTVL